jgi:hypothetical protein
LACWEAGELSLISSLEIYSNNNLFIIKSQFLMQEGY